ncbi:MAG: hypothetical protein SOR65_00055 [Odoribacter sp.]|nr:hypothetical protein [Odoribacter sp.]
MGKYKIIHEDIENINSKEIVKQTNISGVAIVIILGALALGAWGMTFDDPNSSMPTFLFTAAAIFFLSGVIKLLVSRKRYVYLPTKSVLKLETLYFDVHASDELQACLQMKRFDELSRIKREKDNGVKVEAMLSRDGQFAAVQVLEYVPYSFEAVTPVMCFYKEEAGKLSAALLAGK